MKTRLELLLEKIEIECNDGQTSEFKSLDEAMTKKLMFTGGGTDPNGNRSCAGNVVCSNNNRCSGNLACTGNTRCQMSE